jgi:hypothetical protein
MVAGVGIDNFAGSEIGRTSVRPLGCAPWMARIKQRHADFQNGPKKTQRNLPTPNQGLKRDGCRRESW